MKRLLIRFAAVAVVALGVPLVWFAPASAKAPEEQGWWFKGNVGVKLVPPNVPDDGLYVANDPTGAAALSALHFSLADAPGVTITLKLDRSATTREHAIVACPAASKWVGEQGGAWERRPQANCEKGKVRGDPAQNGGAMMWVLPESFANGGTYDIVLLPDPTMTEVFQIPFQAPDESSIAARGGAAPTAPVAPTETVFTAEDLGTESFSSVPSDFSTPSSDFSTPSSDFSTPSIGPSVPDQLEQQAAAPTPPEPQTSLTDRGVSPTHAERWAATSVLVALGLGMWVLSGRSVPAPRLLGGLATASVATAETAH